MGRQMIFVISYVICLILWKVIYGDASMTDCLFLLVYIGIVDILGAISSIEKNLIK